MTSLAIWNQVNRALVGKAIGELTYEEVLVPERVSEGAGGASYELRLRSGIIYRFQGKRAAWGHIRVAAASLERVEAGVAGPADEAGRFFIDAQIELGMTDVVLGRFLEEMHGTLCADACLAEKAVSVEDVSAWDGGRVQSVLNGHPKLILNKGRMGWGWMDHQDYAPESSEGFRLQWLALRKEKAVVSLGAGWSMAALLRESLGEGDWAAFTATMERAGVGFDTHAVIPVHPWQWDHIVRVQFAGDIARGDIVCLGEAGDLHQPQISLRTLSNASRPRQADLKVSLSILNTSAVRGLPAKYAALGTRLSDAVATLCTNDPVLAARQTEVLRDLAGVSYEHATFARVHGAPYRYHEQLGAIWRESVASKLREGEMGVMTGALSHQDGEGRSLIGAYIRKSGLSPDEWVTRYCEVVVIPLYHLQLRYGIGLVAHGQNVVVRLKRYMPEGMLLKDFHGDLRISTESVSERDQALGPAADALDRLAPDHLIHDLVTGHFVSVLRFVSDTLLASDGFPEERFYRILADCLRAYLAVHWPAGVDADRDVLGERLRRVLLNKVRFAIGYADTAERPLPMLGRDIPNPLHLGGCRERIL